LYSIPIFILPIYDFAHVTYDSEPDYLASALNILKYGIPSGYHHPGTLTQYLISIPLLFGLHFDLQLNSIIFLMRAIELIVLMLLVIASINIMGVMERRYKLFIYSLVWLLCLLYPTTSIFFKLVSADTLLFGFSFFMCALWYRFLITEKGIALLGLVIGAGINIKLNFTYVLFVFAVFHMFHYINCVKVKKGLVSIFQIFLLGALWFLIFSIPKILQILSNVLNNDALSAMLDKLSLFSFIEVILFILLTSVVLVFLPKLFYFVNKTTFYNSLVTKNSVTLLESLIMVTPVLIFIVYKMVYYESEYFFELGKWEELGLARRNSVPLYAFLVFVVANTVISRVKKIGKNTASILTIIFFIIGGLVTNITASKNYIFDNHTRLFDTSVSDIRSEFKNASIFIHHDNFFNSVTQFYLWTTIRYGNCASDDLDVLLKSTYPDIGDISYMSPVKGITKCSLNNDSYISRSFYDRWLNIQNNTLRLELCDGLNSVSNDKRKIYLVDKRHLDYSSINNLISDLDSRIKPCGYKMERNTNYFDNDKVLSFDIVKNTFF
jgi:hypothetical protein